MFIYYSIKPAIPGFVSSAHAISISFFVILGNNFLRKFKQQSKKNFVAITSLLYSSKHSLDLVVYLAAVPPNDTLILFIFHYLIYKNIVEDICQRFSRYPDTHSVTLSWPLILVGLSWGKMRKVHIAPRQVSLGIGLSNTLMSSGFLYLHVGVLSISEISGRNKLSVSKLPFLPICFQTSWSPRETVSDGRDTAALVTSSECLGLYSQCYSD